MNNYPSQSEPFLTVFRDEDGVDQLLRDYFHHEMPHPWPAAPTVETNRQEKRTLFSRWNQRTRRYLSLAAAVALFVASYWTLASFFPTGGVVNKLTPDGIIGNNPGLPKVHPGAGHDALPGVDGSQKKSSTRTPDDGQVRERIHVAPNGLIIDVDRVKKLPRQP